MSIKGASFDLSKTRTGACLWEDRTPTRVVSWEFTTAHDVGALLAAFRHKLATAIGVSPDSVDWVAFEDVRPINKHHSELHFGMVGLLAEVCFRRDTPLLRATSSAVKKALAGTGVATKDAMVASARERFPHLNVRDHDQADAVGVGLVAISMITWDDAEPPLSTNPAPF